MTTANRPEQAHRGSATATDRLREQAREVTKELQEMGNIANDAVRENLGQLQDQASDYYQQGRDQACRAEHTFEQFIKEHPLKSILIAAGAGLFVGRFWLRR